VYNISVCMKSYDNSGIAITNSRNHILNRVIHSSAGDDDVSTVTVTYKYTTGTTVV